MFITFEGCEGAGKTTQINRLEDSLVKLGHMILKTREPGGTRLGEALRDLILIGPVEMTPRTEALLFSAARSQHMSEVIIPALDAGKIVLCDRFVDSTLAYQGSGHGEPMEALYCLSDYAIGNRLPDLTVLLDTDPETGLKRKAGSGEWNRLDAKSLAFHRRVRYGFLHYAQVFSYRYLVIDATLPEDKIAVSILDKVRELIRGKN